MGKVKVLTRKRAWEFSCALNLGDNIGSKGRWVAVLSVPSGSVETLHSLEGWQTDDGWNNSYHESSYGEGFVAAWGRSPSRAKKRLKSLLETGKVVIKNNPSIPSRAEARYQLGE